MNPQEDDKAIFGTKKVQNAQPVKNEIADVIERKQMAEYERLKGNEYMKSKDYSEAITYYSKSINYFS